MEKSELSYTAVGNGYSHSGKSWVVCQNAELPYDSEILLLKLNI